MLPIAEMRNNTVNITGLSIRENNVEKIDWVFIQQSLNYQQ